MKYVNPSLARSSRPGWPAKTVAAEFVQEWIALARENGILSIICLLDDDQLSYYEGLKGNLIDEYKTAGFAVAHIPVRDHREPPMTATQLDEVETAYRKLTKPVLVHCSAGLDRTGAVIARLTLGTK